MSQLVTPLPIVWTLADGLQIAQLFESIATQVSLHIALGGSVMYAGQSANDLDLYVYAHKPPIVKEQIDTFLTKLNQFGYDVIRDADLDNEQKEYYRYVYKLSKTGRIVDLFVLRG